MKQQLPGWRDEEMLRDLEFGLRFKEELSNAVVVAPMNGSARPHLAKLREGVLQQVKDGMLRASTTVSVFPSMFYPFGAASPNWKLKYRLTSDLRLHAPVGTLSAWTEALSRNDKCAVGYVAPRWVRLREVLRQGAALHSFWQEAAGRRTESQPSN